MKNTTYESSDESNQLEKLTDWPNEPGVASLNEDLFIAKPSHDSHVLEVERWISLRDVTGKSKPKAAKNRSSVQPKLIRRQAEWRYSALSEPFLSSQKMFTATATTFEDELAANQNELILNWQFRTKMNRVKFIDEYVRTTVDEGTVAVRVGWDRQTKMVKVQAPVWEIIEVQDEETSKMLEQASQIKTDNPRAFKDLPADVQESVSASQEYGAPVQARQIGTEEVEEEKVLVNQPTATILHYSNLYLDPSCEGDVSKAKFGIITFETSKADLIADGRYKNLDHVNWQGNTPMNLPDHASNIDDSVQFKDELRKRVVAYEYWGSYDINSDDTLVPIVATYIGNVMIRMEANPYPDQEIPVVIVPYMPLTHSVTGEPDAELLEENQNILGAVSRGMIDLMGRSANSQTGVAKGLLDVVNRNRFNAGTDYEFNPTAHPENSIHQHKYPEIPNSALTMLQLQNQEAEALSGVKAFSGGISGEAYGDVATGIRGALDASAKREMAILRRMAQGMADIGRKFASMNQAFMSEEETVRVTNKTYVTVKREELAGEFDLEVDISTAEIDEAKSQDLSFMLQTMGNNMDFTMTQMLLAEIATLKRMPALAEKIMQFKPEPDPLDQKMKELEIAKLEAEIEEIRSKSMVNQSKARTEGSSADLKDLEFVEKESGTEHMRNLDVQGEQARSNQDLEITKSFLAQRDPAKPNPDMGSALAYKELVTG